MISPKTKRRRKKHNKESKSEENEDRISDLPDCVLLHILSFLNTKHAVQTCILSTRWKHLWKRLPTLALRSSHFRTLKGFTKFVFGVFDLRDGSIALHDLDFHRSGRVEPHLLKRIVTYAVSHDVQRLRIDVACDIERLPPCIFSCQTLTSLSLSVNSAFYHRIALFPNTLNLPALTSLYLEDFAFGDGNDGRADPFSACNRLNSLIINSCRVLGAENLCISSTTLVNLTIHNDTKKMISPKTKRRRKKHNKESKSEENEDRISDLPDCVLLHILSFLNTKHAVQTCILSTRWKHLWKCLPTLTLSSSHFSTLKGFTKFVSRILSLRDALTALHDLDFHRSGSVEPHLLKRIVKYAVSHDVQRLQIDVTCDIERLPPCIFSCQTLTSLCLSVKPASYHRTTLFPNTLNLPALTSLYLQYFDFRGGNDGLADPFSACNRLNSLIFDCCRVLNAENLCISSTTLVNLTIYNDRYYYPWCNCKIEISAPSLCRFSFTGIPLQKLYGSDLSFIKQVNIEADMAWYKRYETPLVLLSWLIELSDITSLTVSSNTLQVLSLVPDLLKAKLPSLCNLKSRKVIMKPLSYELRMMLRGPNPNSWKEAAKIPDGIVDFLFKNSPLAKVDIIDITWNITISNQINFSYQQLLGFHKNITWNATKTNSYTLFSDCALKFCP